MLRQLARVRLGIADPAAQPVLLVGPRHEADRSTRLDAEPLHETQHLPRGHDTARIIHRALAHVPRINVAAEHDDLVRLLSALEVGDDVARRRIGEQLRAHHELDAHGQPARLQPVQHPGILHRDRGGGNLRHRRVVAQPTGVRARDAERPDRTQQHRHRARLGGRTRTERAVLHRRAVVGERHVEQHDLALHVGGALLQFVEARDHDDWSRDAARRRTHAAAQAEHPEWGAPRFDQLGRLGAAHPVRHHHRLGVHIVEAVLPELRLKPVDRPLERGRTAQPVAVRVHELGQSNEAGRVGQRAVDELVGRGAVARGRFGSGLRLRAERERECGGCNAEGQGEAVGGAKERRLTHARVSEGAWGGADRTEAYWGTTLEGRALAVREAGGDLEPAGGYGNRSRTRWWHEGSVRHELR